MSVKSFARKIAKKSKAAASDFARSDVGKVGISAFNIANTPFNLENKYISRPLARATLAALTGISENTLERTPYVGDDIRQGRQAASPVLQFALENVISPSNYIGPGVVLKGAKAGIRGYKGVDRAMDAGRVANKFVNPEDIVEIGVLKGHKIKVPKSFEKLQTFDTFGQGRSQSAKFHKFQIGNIEVGLDTVDPVDIDVLIANVTGTHSAADAKKVARFVNIVKATNPERRITAMPANKSLERIYRLAGFKSSPSNEFPRKLVLGEFDYLLDPDNPQNRRALTGVRGAMKGIFDEFTPGGGGRSALVNPDDQASISRQGVGPLSNDDLARDRRLLESAEQQRNLDELLNAPTPDDELAQRIVDQHPNKAERSMTPDKTLDDYMYDRKTMKPGSDFRDLDIEDINSIYGNASREYGTIEMLRGTNKFSPEMDKMGKIQKSKMEEIKEFFEEREKVHEVLSDRVDKVDLSLYDWSDPNSATYGYGNRSSRPFPKGVVRDIVKKAKEYKLWDGDFGEYFADYLNGWYVKGEIDRKELDSILEQMKTATNDWSGSFDYPD